MAARKEDILSSIRVAEDIARFWKVASVTDREMLQEQMRRYIRKGAKTKNGATHFSGRESELLLIIGRHLTTQQRHEIEELTDKMEYGSLADIEHERLIALADESEKIYAQRLRAMLELAELRGISFDELSEVFMTTTATLTIDTVLDSVGQLSDAGKRQVAINLLQQFDSAAILEIIRQLKPFELDYQDPGSITDEESIASAEEAFLAYDREEAANA